MSDKVKLPKEVAKAITDLKTHHGGNQTILEGVLGNANGSCIITVRDYMYKRGFDNLLKALVNGYEVEETPEDKVRKAFECALENIEKLDDHPQAEHWQPGAVWFRSAGRNPPGCDPQPAARPGLQRLQRPVQRAQGRDALHRHPLIVGEGG